ncbi:collagen alpha-1(I) chain-like [Capricornis sumatraensis]|uniref:collagen alpha-1(I) chain-like n=1 Tax=Capricornis sumatraensis TaxID=34865 RepID=UPI0036046D70
METREAAKGLPGPSSWWGHPGGLPPSDFQTDRDPGRPCTALQAAGLRRGRPILQETRAAGAPRTTGGRLEHAADTLDSEGPGRSCTDLPALIPQKFFLEFKQLKSSWSGSDPSEDPRGCLRARGLGTAGSLGGTVYCLAPVSPPWRAAAGEVVPEGHLGAPLLFPPLPAKAARPFQPASGTPTGARKGISARRGSHGREQASSHGRGGRGERGVPPGRPLLGAAPSPARAPELRAGLRPGASRAARARAGRGRRCGDAAAGAGSQRQPLPRKWGGPGHGAGASAPDAGGVWGPDILATPMGLQAGGSREDTVPPGRTVAVASGVVAALGSSRQPEEGGSLGRLHDTGVRARPQGTWGPPPRAMLLESGGTCSALQRGSSRTADSHDYILVKQKRSRKAGGGLREGPGLEVVRVDMGVLGPPEVLTLPREEIGPGGLDGTRPGPSSEGGPPSRQLRVHSEPRRNPLQCVRELGTGQALHTHPRRWLPQCQHAHLMGHDTAKEQRRALAQDLTEESAAHAFSLQGKHGESACTPCNSGEIRSEQAAERWRVPSPGRGPPADSVPKPSSNSSSRADHPSTHRPRALGSPGCPTPSDLSFNSGFSTVSVPGGRGTGCLGLRDGEPGALVRWCTPDSRHGLPGGAGPGTITGPGAAGPGANRKQQVATAPQEEGRGPGMATPPATGEAAAMGSLGRSGHGTQDEDAPSTASQEATETGRLAAPASPDCRAESEPESRGRLVPTPEKLLPPS